MGLFLFDPRQVEIVVSIVIAMILGGAIGLERAILAKPAGMRTHMLVCGAAALLVSLDRMLTVRFGIEFGTSGFFRADPVGVIQAIVTGVSFLGAGTIIRQTTGEHIEGLTTAASLLFTAAMGIAVGLSLWLLGLAATILALLVLHGVPRIESSLVAWRERQLRKPERDRPGT